MSSFSYFRLRIAQQGLCVSYSVPVAIFLTTAFSPLNSGRAENDCSRRCKP
ncbi:hypothetical protein B2D83_004128 [Salmonella enterica subsp. enterica serovar Javiana]|nr:hypothetical protein [Salmonella enterica subsp. enterica serovar Javiana]